MDQSRQDLVGWARQTIARGSKSFGLASRILPRRERENAWLLYAWCRTCDDLTDGQDLGHYSGDLPKGQADLWELTGKALLGEEPVPRAFAALRAVQRDAGLPLAQIEDHLRGFDLDRAGWRPRDLQDLEGYCFHVAGAVGCLMAVLMGISPQDKDTLARASDLGLAFQLNNIARDIVDDAWEGRCYLPAAWLDDAGLESARLVEASARESLAILASRLNDRARVYDVSSRVGAARLPWRCRFAILAAANIYGAIGEKVARDGVTAWDGRVFTTGREKLEAVALAMAQSLRAPQPAERHGLFNRVDWYASGRLQQAGIAMRSLSA